MVEEKTMTAEERRPAAGEAVAESLELAGTLLEGVAEEIRAEKGRMVIRVKAADVPAAARKLRDDGRLSYKYLSFVSAVDYGSRFEAIYILRSADHPVTTELRAALDGEDPVVPTVSDIFSTAGWHERETCDLLGIHFDGNQDLRRILTRDSFEGYPLRKDAVPVRQKRPEWKWEGIAPPVRLPGEKSGGSP